MSEPTDTITIRVPKSIKEKLEEMSKKNQVNLNLLVNQILSKNVHWDEHITKMGWLQFNPFTVQKIFGYLDEQEISELAKSIKQEIINGIKFIYGDTSFEHAVEFMDSWLNAANTPFRHTEDSGSHKFIVNHVMGKKWSDFAIEVSEEFVTELGYSITNLNAEKESYSFTISK